jgi:hypothetical protein
MRPRAARRARPKMHEAVGKYLIRVRKQVYRWLDVNVYLPEYG